MDKTRIHPRKIARQMAKAQLDQKHVTGYNKERIDTNGRKVPSMFARYWRSLAKEAAEKVYPKKKGRA